MKNYIKKWRNKYNVRYKAKLIIKINKKIKLIYSFRKFRYIIYYYKYLELLYAHLSASRLYKLNQSLIKWKYYNIYKINQNDELRKYIENKIENMKYIFFNNWKKYIQYRKMKYEQYNYINEYKKVLINNIRLNIYINGIK